MKLLDRTRLQFKPARANTSPMSTSFIHHDAHIHDFDAIQRRRAAATLRPQTSDGIDRHSKSARMSFFEAFAIDAGEDVFSFPKPRSAKAAPKEIQLLASVASSREASPLIGVAFGSPSHPPQYWGRLSSFGPGSANATPRTPRFIESFADELALVPDHVEKTPSAWKRVGSIFRRSTKPKKQKVVQSPEEVAPRPSTSHRPKSRGRTLLSLSRKSGEILRRHELSDPQEGIEPPLTSPPTWLTWQPSPKLGSPLRKTHRSRPSKVSRVMADDATLHITIAPTHETSLVTRPSLPVPKIELQLPSCQLERYSVMFEKVLEQKPSLLERRKSRLRLLDGQELESDADIRLSPLHVNRRPLGRSATSPSLSPSHLFPSTLRNGPQSRVIAFHKPLALRRSNTTPVLSISPLRRSFVATAMTPEMRFDSPVSSDDTTSFLNTPPFSMDEEASIHVVNDSLPSFQITDYEKSITNVWQTALPPQPHSTTSSRFSIDVHKVLDSPKLLSRSRSFSGKDESTKPSGRQIQVAVARRVDIVGRDSLQLGGAKPKVIQVGAQAHQRKPTLESTVR